MGRLEKIVVLTVLFLVAVVLGIALTPTDGKAARKEARAPAQGTLDPALGAAKTPAAGTETRGLLSAGAELPAPAGAKTDGGAPANPAAPAGNAAPAKTEPPVVVAPPAAPAPYILTTDGLVASSAPNMMFYAWKQGDTFSALALRFYGSKDKAARLSAVNEGRSEANLAEGEQIWVPVAESSRAALADDGGKLYVVQKGDVLSSISQHFYGTSKKWQKILDANRDTLASPEKLKIGMRLRIPE